MRQRVNPDTGEKYKSRTELLDYQANKRFQKEIEIVPFETLDRICASRVFNGLEIEEREFYFSLLGKIVDSLPEKEKSVIKKRFYEQKTLEAAGKEMSLTHERIRQIEEEAIKKLYYRAKKAGLEDFYADSN